MPRRGWWLAAALATTGIFAAPATASGGDPATSPPSCDTTATAGEAWASDEVVTAETVAESDGVTVRAAVYPKPDGGGDPWSQWGQGIVTEDGRFLSAAGDHLGEDGNSYLYEYDPGSGELTTISDVLSLVDHQQGAWGYGKVHAQMVPGPCGEVYAATYWGTRDDLRYGDGYDGDLLLRLDPEQRTTAVVGVPAPGHGIPSLAAAPDLGLVYGEAPEPTGEDEDDAGVVFAHDLATGDTEIIYGSSEHRGYRAMAVDAEGRALFTSRTGALSRYDPVTGDVTPFGDALPGEFLRAATPPAPDGTIYGVTQKPEEFFALSPDGTITGLGAAPGYTASLAMEPDGSTVYFVPGAKGDAWLDGTPLMALDTATGDQRVVAELNPPIEAELGMTVTGTYGIALDAESRRLFLSLNAAPAGSAEESPFGEVVLAEVTLPGAPPSVPVTTDPSPTEPTGSETTLVCWSAPVTDVGDGEDGVTWDDATESSGLDGLLVGMMGHAAAWGDVDADGASDLFVGTFADRPVEDYQQRGADGPASDQLLLGGDATFAGSGTAFELGRTTGALAVDLDLDLDLDLIATRNVTERTPEPTIILRNDDGRLTPQADTGLDPASPGRSIGVLDVDGDSLLDLVVTEDRFRGGSSRLYRNVGGLQYEEAADALGLPAGVDALGVAVGDVNADGLDDVVFAGTSNRVFVGTGSGLREVDGVLDDLEVYGEEDDAAGVALGDVNGDGLIDVVVGQHFNSTVDDDQEVPVRLFLNRTAEAGDDPVFEDVTDDAGLVGLPTKAPHVALVDLDNDGHLDLLTTASAGDGLLPAVFRNGGDHERGGVPTFAAPSGTGSDQYWIGGPTADVDRDGRLDVLLVEWDPALASRLLLNRTASGHWLEVSVDASLGGGHGSVVDVYEAGGLGDPEQLVGRHLISPSQGYSSGVEAVAHIGLGDRETVDVRITPPAPHDPIELTDLEVDRHVRVPDGCVAGVRAPPSEPPGSTTSSVPAPSTEPTSPPTSGTEPTSTPPTAPEPELLPALAIGLVAGAQALATGP